MFVTLIVSTVWLGLGGLRDLKRLIDGLRGTARDDGDDGWVSREHDAGKEG